ncbi:MAG: hypothetical protein QM764_05670 [Chitinophagaceae bacterium]
MGKRINSVEALDQEILRLQAKAKVLENELDHSLDYLQDNYSSMIMNSVFSRTAGNIKNGVVGTVLSLVMSNEKLMDAVGSITGQLLNKLAEGLEKLTERFGKK